MSIEEARSQKWSSPGSATTFTVGEGFGAVQGQTPGMENMGCFVDIDAANGQTLETGLTWLGGEEMSNQDMCAKAKQAAEFAVTNLQARG